MDCLSPRMVPIVQSLGGKRIEDAAFNGYDGVHEFLRLGALRAAKGER